MAKTQSQIIAERKAVNDKLNAIHQKQMAGVAEKAAARTYVVLAKGAETTKDSARKAELSRAAQSVVDEYVKFASTQKKESAKTAQDMQKKKEDRSEEKKRIASLYTQKANAEKVLREFDETRETDWTDASARRKHEMERARLQGEVDRAGAEIDTQKNQQIHDKNLAAIEDMSAEDRATLEKYVRERDERDDPLTVSNPLRFLMQDKKVSAVYAPLVEKYGEERLAKLAETYGRVLHERDAKEIIKDTTAAVDTVPGAIGHNLLSVPASGIGGVLGTLGRVNELFTRTGQYSTLEEYTPGDALNLYASTVRGATAQNIEGEDGGAGRKALSVGYQGIMTLADSISRSLALGPAGGAALAATGSFSQTVSEATKQGATPQQAVALGVATAGMEYVSEKIPMDEVFKLAKGGKTNVLMQAFKQAGVEITTEELSLFGSMAAEAAILQEKSSYKQQIGDLVAGGMSYEDAKAQADKAVWEEVKQTAYVSGFSGFLSGGGGAVVGNLTTNTTPEVTEEVRQEPPVQTPPEAPVVDEGQQTGPTTEQLLDGVQDMTPAPAPLPEGLQHFHNAAAIANGLDVEVQKNTAETGGIWDKLRGYTQHEKENWKTSKRIVLCDSIEHLRKFVSNALTSKTQTHKKMYFGAITPNLATEIQNATGVNVEGYNLSLGEDEVRKINKSHGNENKESLRGQRAVTEADYLAIPDIVQNADSIKRSDSDYEGKPAIEFQKRNGNEITTVVAVVSDKRLDVFVQTEYINKKSGSIATPEPVQAGSFTSETPGGTAPNSGDVTQTPAEGQVTSRETNARSDSVSPSPVNIIPETTLEVNENPAIESDYDDEFENWGADPNREGVENPLSDRSYSEVGKRSVKAYMYENPAVKPFYQEQAAWLLSELADSTRGERTYNEQVHYESGGEHGWSGTKRHTSESIAELLDQDGMTYDQIERGLNAIVNDHGQENNAVSKRIEFIINDRLMNGYTDFYTGQKVPGNVDYLELLRNQQSAPDVDTSEAVQMDASNVQQQSTEDAQENAPGTVGAKESQFRHEVKQSKVYGNTYQNTPYADVHDIGRAAKKADPNIDQYDVITEAESVHEAELRTQTGRDRLAEHHALMKKDGWTGADNDTAMRLLTVYRREGKKDRFLELSRKQRQMGTQAGQMVQSFAKYSREDATVAVQDAIADLDELTIDQVDRTFWKPKQETKGAQGKKDAFQKWKESITGSLLEVANDIENVEDGDKAAMKDLVRQIANLRHTTAWAGYSSDLSRRTERGLDKMDFDTLKTVAKTQLRMIPNDFRKRDTGEILKQIRVQNMLFTLTTKFKNDAGNITNGIMDAVSDSFGGRMIDAVLGKMTGQRTVGNDLKFAKEYGKAARDAADVASAFVSLDIPMEVDAKYSSGRTRTWTPNTTNVFGRLMSAYEKHMKYALEVSDKFYEGGAAHVVNKSLQSLGEKSGLTPEQIQDIAQKTGERRTFKDPGASVDKSGQPKNGRMLARANVGLQKALNQIGTENIGLGDMVMPFAAVSGEVKQVGMDYTGGGLISGMKEIISIAKDVRNGKEIAPYRQRTAATNFGRGMTGVGLIAAFTAFAAAGAVKVHNDRDSEERMMNQTQGLSGAQWNLNSSIRWWEATMNGATAEEAAKAAEWQSGDELITIDFLEPYNTQMHIGYLLSQGEDIPTAIMQGNFNSLLEMPMMQTLSDLADLQQAFTEVSDGDMDGVYDAAGQLVGTVAGSVIPNWMRKTAQVIDPYYRDTYDTNPFRKAAKEVVAATPVSAALPKKYDNLGKEQRRFDESEWMAATFDNLVTPWDAETYQTNPVYQEIERLNAIDGIDVTPPQAKRKFTYTDRSGTEHENYSLSAEQYETLQRVQGQTAMELIENTMLSADYAHMTDAQKDALFQNIYSYAEEHGRRAAISDYHSEAAEWMDKISGDPVNGLIRRATLSVIDSAVDKAMESIKNHWEMNPETKSNLDTLYDSFDDLSEDARKKILDDAVSDTARFLEVRSRGVRTEQYLDAVDYIADFPGTGSIDPDTGKPRQRDIDVREAIGKISGESNDVKDILMKAYMDDGDSTEMKYDYVRKEIGLSPLEYARAYRVQLDGGKKEQKMAKWKAQGLSDKEADLLYCLFAATGKTKIDVEAWAKKQ